MRVLISALCLCACAAPSKLSHVPIGTQLLVAGVAPVLEVRSPYTGYPEDRYGVRGAPTALTVTLDGRKSVVARTGGLTVIDLLNERHHRFVELGATPAGVAMLDRRSHAVLATPGELLVADLQSARVERRLDTGVPSPLGLALDRGRTRALVAGARSAAWVDLEAGSVQAVVLGLEPRALLRRPATSEVWVVGRGPAVTFDLERGTVASLALPCEEAAGLFFDARGSRAAISDPRRRVLWVIDAATGELQHEVPLDAEPGFVLVEPRGAYAYVALPALEVVTVVDLARGAVTGSFDTDTAPRALGITTLRWGWDAQVSSGDGGDQ